MSDEVTILILSRNRSWSLLQCVSSIREWTKTPYHIVIQDHDSNEQHWPMIRILEGPDCTVLRCNTFLSCNEGRRVGLDHVPGKYVVFLDDDIKVSRGWLEKLMEPMSQYDGVGAVCGQLVQNYGMQKMSWARMLRDGESVRMKYGFEGWCDFCGGGATLYDIEALRGTEFRREFNGTGEDWDQILQMSENDWRIRCENVKFFHFHQSDYDEYGVDRWRYSEIMDSGIGLWDRWGIKTVVAEQFAAMIKRGIPLLPEQQKRVREITQL